MRSSLHRARTGRFLAKSLMTVATAALLAGCSNSIERFSNAYNNPSDADPVYTASVPKARKAVATPAYRAPAYKAPAYDAQADENAIEETPVARAAIPQPQPRKSYDYSQAYQPAYKQPGYKKPKLVVPQEDYAAAPEEPAQYDTPAAPVKRKTFAQAPATGAKLRVENGMTMYSIARTNGVSVQELAAANNMQAPYSLMVGQTLRIPGATTAQAPDMGADAPAAPVRKPRLAAAEEDTAPVAPAKGGARYTVSTGDTLYLIGRKFGVSPFVIADANGLKADQQLSLGKSLRIPGAKSSQTAAVQDDVAPVIQPSKKKKAPLALTEEEQQQATADEPAAEPDVPAVPAKKVAQETAPEPDQMAAAPVSPTGLNLRWPLKGKVISGFGAKPNGLKNEGINIAVPEGASVRAAEGGVVAYAGNELKGYGNLVLIRHTGGYVTAYAHAKELFVKRGDTVTRGQVIAKAGQTGAVSSPQLHFEVRKGATALDPMKFMSSTTASN